MDAPEEPKSPRPPKVTMRMASSLYQAWITFRDGRRRLKSCHTRRKAVAKEYAVMLQEQILAGKYPPSESSPSHESVPLIDVPPSPPRDRKPLLTDPE